ncbi:cyclodehydratase [Rhodococcus aerolatus]
MTTSTSAPPAPAPTPLDPAPVLRAGVPVVARGAGAVQVGWDPERALLLELGPGGDGPGLRDLLRSLDGSRSAPECRLAAARLGLPAPEWTALLTSLRDADLVQRTTAAPPSTVLLHGEGPLTALLTRWLPGPTTVVRRSRHRLPDQLDESTPPALVVLADALVTEPRVCAELVAARVPHLPVLLRDGTGLVGPLVLPGRSACLRCTDLHRRDLDPAWPLVAAQLLGRTGAAGPGTLRATAALACAQVEAVLAGPAGPAPASLGATLTADLGGGGVPRRPWRPHPDCGCGAWA